LSKISSTYPWKNTPDVSPTVYEGILSFWGFGEVWGIFPGYVGKIIDFEVVRSILSAEADLNEEISARWDHEDGFFRYHFLWLKIH